MTDPASDVVGFVGLGAMGGRMATQLLTAGIVVAAHDVNEQALRRLVAQGALACDSAAQVADLAPTVFVSLPDPGQVRHVACGENGLIHGSGIGTYVDLSTTGPVVAAEVAGRLAGAGISCVDAPVSGGVVGAAAGTLSIMAAGASAAIAQVRRYLEILGGRIFVVGDRPGQGQVVKLANNLLSASAIAATAEALTLGAKEGIDPAVMLEIFNTSSGRNTATADKFPKHVLTRTFDFGFRLELMKKDIQLCLECARTLGLPAPIAASMEQLLTIASASCERDADVTELATVFENWAHVTIQSAGQG